MKIFGLLLLTGTLIGGCTFNISPKDLNLLKTEGTVSVGSTPINTNGAPVAGTVPETFTEWFTYLSPVLTILVYALVIRPLREWLKGKGINGSTSTNPGVSGDNASPVSGNVVSKPPTKVL